MKSALDGLKVLDMGRVQAAPHCSALLADMGADVIKLEMPEVGDEARYNHPIGTYFATFNRNKRGITLNLKTGKDVFFKLIKEVDILVENFRPGVMDKLGLGYEELKKVNPGLIYAAISGYGQNGSYKNLAGYDPIAQAMSGMMSITGFEDREPVRAGAAICDIMAGQNAAIGVLAALQYRNHTGMGQMIDVSLCDSSIVALSSIFEIFLTHGTVPIRRGNGYAAWAPGGSYKAKDGYFTLTATGEDGWRDLCEIMGQPELIGDSRFTDSQARVQNHVELDQFIEEWTKTKTVDELMALCAQKKIAAAPVMNLAQVYHDPHFSRTRNMFVTVEHPSLGKIRVLNNAIKMSETPSMVRCSSPELGQHNYEIYQQLGYSIEQIKEMKQKGII